MAGVWQRCTENELGQARRWVGTDKCKKVGVGKERIEREEERYRRDNR